MDRPRDNFFAGPLSPVIRMVALVTATFSTSASRRCMTSLAKTAGTPINSQASMSGG